jgi:hypothetical protein
MKHFETIWEEAERTVTDAFAESESLDPKYTLEECIFGSIISHAEALKSEMNNPDEDLDKMASAYIGEMLLMMSFLSKKLDVDVYSALKKAMSGVMIDHLGKDD